VPAFRRRVRQALEDLAPNYTKLRATRGLSMEEAELEDRRFAKVALPMGSDRIIYGDKVINVGNHGGTQCHPTAGFCPSDYMPASAILHATSKASPRSSWARSIELRKDCS
jgi:hypothetical protein